MRLRALSAFSTTGRVTCLEDTQSYAVREFTEFLPDHPVTHAAMTPASHSGWLSADGDSGAAGGGAGAGGPRASLADVLSERLDVESQLRGNLWKKDTAGSSSWKLRFFVIKDGFLLYYPEQTSATMTFDMHPKGVVPLDGVEIETVRTGPKPGLTSSVRLTHPSFGTKSMILCARDDAERDKWVTALSASSYM